MARCHEYEYSREQCLSMSVLIKSHSTKGLQNSKQWFGGTNKQFGYGTVGLSGLVFVLFVHHNDQPRGTAFFFKIFRPRHESVTGPSYLKQRQQLTAS